MKPLTLILAATDLSAPARHAVERAMLLAAATGAHCSVLLPIDFSPVSVPLVRFVRRLAPEADLVLMEAQADALVVPDPRRPAE